MKNCHNASQRASSVGHHCVAQHAPPMITNPIINRIGALVLLFAVYAVGISIGREQATQGHAAAHQPLKP